MLGAAPPLAATSPSRSARRWDLGHPSSFPEPPSARPLCAQSQHEGPSEDLAPKLQFLPEHAPCVKEQIPGILRAASMYFYSVYSELFDILICELMYISS